MQRGSEQEKGGIGNNIAGVNFARGFFARVQWGNTGALDVMAIVITLEIMIVIMWRA